MLVMLFVDMIPSGSVSGPETPGAAWRLLVLRLPFAVGIRLAVVAASARHRPFWPGGFIGILYHPSHPDPGSNCATDHHFIMMSSSPGRRTVVASRLARWVYGGPVPIWLQWFNALFYDDFEFSHRQIGHSRRGTFGRAVVYAMRL